MWRTVLCLALICSGCGYREQPLDDQVESELAEFRELIVASGADWSIVDLELKDAPALSVEHRYLTIVHPHPDDRAAVEASLRMAYKIACAKVNEKQPDAQHKLVLVWAWDHWPRRAGRAAICVASSGTLASDELPIDPKIQWN